MVKNHQTSKLNGKKQYETKRHKTNKEKQPKANRQSREMKFLKLLNILRDIRAEIALRKKMLFKKLDHNQELLGINMLA